MMTYYVYIAHNENRDTSGGRAWGISRPIAFVDFVRHRKDGKARLENICERHSNLLPQEGWGRVTHRAIDTDDNAVIERMKNDIRTKLAAISTAKTGERRLWARKPGSPAGCYRLEFWEVNRVVTQALNDSGLYRPG